ncbi:MAG: iron-containing alcohol dehydrogenase [Oscillospiraceae bacterium]|nr:iron-containing alcohol dehydrogenase [Oscillospiraceae bacterium]
MNNFTFWSPTKVVFGENTVSSVGEEIKSFGGTKVLVFYGMGSAVSSGVLERVTDSLNEAGLKYFAVGGVQINPTVEFAQKVVGKHRDSGFDFVLGVGGGSVIDTAKAVAHGLANPDVPLWDIFSLKVNLERSLPVGAVLTIAAAGSETSSSAVLTNTKLKIKRGLTSQLNRPQFAVMDPTLTYSLPVRHTVCGVVDILMHTLDRYFAPDADNALTDELSEALMRIVVRYGRVAMEWHDDYKARSELMWAGSLSHNALTGLGQTLDFSVHQLGHAISGKFDIPHGESLSITWPAWAKYVYRTDVDRFARYARKVWGITASDGAAAALAGISATVEFFRSLGAPVSLAEGVPDDAEFDIEELASLCSYNKTRTIGSFQVLDYNDILEIYRLAL